MTLPLEHLALVNFPVADGRGHTDAGDRVQPQRPQRALIFIRHLGVGQDARHVARRQLGRQQRCALIQGAQQRVPVGQLIQRESLGRQARHLQMTHLGVQSLHLRQPRLEGRRLQQRGGLRLTLAPFQSRQCGFKISAKGRQEAIRPQERVARQALLAGIDQLAAANLPLQRIVQVVAVRRRQLGRRRALGLGHVLDRLQQRLISIRRQRLRLPCLQGLGIGLARLGSHRDAALAGRHDRHPGRREPRTSRQQRQQPRCQPCMAFPVLVAHLHTFLASSPSRVRASATKARIPSASFSVAIASSFRSKRKAGSSSDSRSICA